MEVQKLLGLCALLLAVDLGWSFQIVPPSLLVFIDNLLLGDTLMDPDELGPHRAKVINFAQEEENIQGAFNLWNRPGLRYLVDLMFITAAMNDSDIEEWARERNLEIATDDTDISEWLKKQCVSKDFSWKREGIIVPRKKHVTVPYAPDGFDEALWFDMFRKWQWNDITDEEFFAYEAREYARVEKETATKQLLDAVTKLVTSFTESTEETSTMSTIKQALSDAVSKSSSKQRLLDAVTELMTSRTKTTEEPVTMPTTKQVLIDAVAKLVTSNTPTTEEVVTTPSSKQELLDAVAELVTASAETTEETVTDQLLDAVTELVTSNVKTVEEMEIVSAASIKQALFDAVTKLETSRTPSIEEMETTPSNKQLYDAIVELVTSSDETTEKASTEANSMTDETSTLTTEDIFHTSENSDLETDAEVTTLAQEMRTLMAEQRDQDVRSTRESRKLVKRDSGKIFETRKDDFLTSRDIPGTSFTCTDKPHVPGFYADMDTGCQVFHVCYPRRTESFLCPVGSLFNQKRMACDRWWDVDCTQSSAFYDSNVPFSPSNKSDMDWTRVHKFLPVNSKVYLHQDPKEEAPKKQPQVLEIVMSYLKSNDVLIGVKRIGNLLLQNISAKTLWKIIENYSELAKHIEA